MYHEADVTIIVDAVMEIAPMVDHKEGGKIIIMVEEIRDIDLLLIMEDVEIQVLIFMKKIILTTIILQDNHGVMVHKFPISHHNFIQLDQYLEKVTFNVNCVMVIIMW